MENGEYTLSSESLRIADGKVEKKPIIEWFKSQGRFKHLVSEERWEDVVEECQNDIDRQWKKLLKLCDL